MVLEGGMNHKKVLLQGNTPNTICRWLENQSARRITHTTDSPNQTR